jgi:hypothetical protein
VRALDPDGLELSGRLIALVHTHPCQRSSAVGPYIPGMGTSRRRR